MSASALAGLFALNLLYLVCGTAVLWLIRGWRSWWEVLRLAGLSYLVGIVVVGGIWVFWLIAGIPFSLGVVLGVPLAVAVCGALAAHQVGRPRPAGGHLPGGRELLITAVGIAAAGVLLEALFRSARLAGLYEWDAWSFWIPKAEAIYYFRGLDEQLFTTLPGAPYPPLVPTLDAAAFHAMGGADVVTLHVQYWLFGVGFVWALAGVLAERAPAWILWPFVLIALLAPRVGRRFLITEADLLLDFLFVLAAVLLVVWIADRERWRLVVATLLLCGMVLTKREGLLLGALLVTAALVASARQWRTTWPALGASAAVAVLVAAPWRIWYVAHDVGGEGPSQGFLQRDNFEWFWPAVKRAVDVQWDPGYWSVIVPVAVLAVIVAVVARLASAVVFFGTLLALVTLGGIWATWVFSKPWETGELGGNFILRFMGSSALLCAAFAPLLLGAAWRKVNPERERPRAMRSQLALASAVVVVPLLAYPLVAVAGGGPRFPTRSECVRVATGDADDLEVVYGHLDNPVAAEELFRELNEAGFVGAQLEPDGCGRWKVSYDAIDSLAQGEALAVEARKAGFEARVEHEG